jgi:hypothetical protein
MKRKLTWICAVGLAALVAAGAAVAHGRHAGTGVKAVAAHFTAAPTDKTTTRTCTEPGTGGAVWHLTRGVYTGTSTGDLAGDITIRTESTINTTTGLGFTKGRVELRDPSTHKVLARASLSAVNTQNGVLNGLLQGRTKDGMLLANFSAAFNSTGTSLTGDVGSATTGQNSAIVFGGLPQCDPSPKPARHEKGKHRRWPHSVTVVVKIRHR